MFGNVCKEGATQTVGSGITRIFPGVRTNVCFRIPDPEARFSKVPVGAILSTKIPTGKSGPPQRIFELRFESR